MFCFSVNYLIIFLQLLLFYNNNNNIANNTNINTYHIQVSIIIILEI